MTLFDRADRLLRGTPVEGAARGLARFAVRRLGGTPVGPPVMHPPGHFYSPVPSLEDIEAYRRRVRSPLSETLGGIDLRVEQQAALLAQFRAYYDTHPFPPERTPELATGT